MEYHKNAADIYNRLDILDSATVNEDVMETIDRKEMMESIQKVINSLTDREREVLTFRFGLDDGKCRTLQEVGWKFDETPERIRMIEARALRKLRHPTRIRKLEGYLELPGS